MSGPGYKTNEEAKRFAYKNSANGRATRSVFFWNAVFSAAHICERGGTILHATDLPFTQNHVEARKDLLCSCFFRCMALPWVIGLKRLGSFELGIKDCSERSRNHSEGKIMHHLLKLPAWIEAGWLEVNLSEKFSFPSLLLPE
jgi:hypothetical protein